jgi:hypothetical protein
VGLSDVVIDEFASETEAVSDFFALRHFQKDRISRTGHEHSL